MAETEPTRVLILTKGLGLGGAETLIAQAARHWDRDRFDYKVAYLLPWKDNLVPALREEGVDVVDIKWNGPQSIGGLLRLRGLARRWKPHIVHSHLPAAGIVARLLLRADHVYTEHNVVDFYRPATRTLNRWTYGLNSAVISVSRAVAESTNGYPGPHPIVIPNGIEKPRPTRAPEDIKRSLGLENGNKLIVHVGNIRPNKGQENLVRAAALLSEMRSNFRVVSIGSEKYHGDIQRLDDLAHDLGVAQTVQFLGSRSDAVSFMAAADVVVNPAEVEGLPLSLLEAMYLEKPVVATAVGGVPSVIRHRVNGLLVDPGSPNELASALDEALDSDHIDEWSSKARNTVEARHGIEKMVRSYEDIYLQVAR